MAYKAMIYALTKASRKLNIKNSIALLTKGF